MFFLPNCIKIFLSLKVTNRQKPTNTAYAVSSMLRQTGPVSGLDASRLAPKLLKQHLATNTFKNGNVINSCNGTKWNPIWSNHTGD